MPHIMYMDPADPTLPDYRQDAELRLNRDQATRLPTGALGYGDLFPVMHLAEGEVAVDSMVWGFAGWTARTITYARSETALEKPMFRQAMRDGRCVVPVSGFVDRIRREDANGQYLFREKGRDVLHLAGCWKLFAAKDGPIRRRFVLLSTPSNPSLAGSLDGRMPVTLRDAECLAWLKGERTEDILHRIPFALVKRRWPVGT